METENRTDVMNPGVNEINEIEALLARVEPSEVPASLIERIGVDLNAPRVREADAQTKVVPFPGARCPRESRRAGSWNWLAAAAVAMLGALFAWFVPQSGGSGPIVVSSNTWNGPSHFSVPAASARTGVVPAAVQSRFGGVRDEGVVWPAPGKAMRKIRVVYLDKVKTRDDQGRTVEVTVPRVQYVLVPEQVD